MDMRFKVAPKFSVIGPKSDQIWSQRCPKSEETWSKTVPKWSAGRLLTLMVGHVPILDRGADRGAETLDRFWKVFGSQNR